MFGWLFGKKSDEKIVEETKKSFSAVKKDMEETGKWIKHLDMQDKQLFDELKAVKQDLSSIRDEIESLREGVELANESEKSKQLFEKPTRKGKQTADLDVEEAVQTPVQTANFYEILKGLSANERLLVFTLMNSEMKLSYEDLALLLGKERSTVRGQINSVKQKSPGIIEEITEKNGKKRVFVPEEIKEKLRKYAKVRVKGG
jgi:predicted transcriptional regulator